LDLFFLDVCQPFKGVKIKKKGKTAKLLKKWIEMGCDLIRSCDHLCLGASTTKPCIFDVHFFPVLLRRPGGHGGGSRVYFSPLRGNAWKPRSWENMGQVQKLWLLTAIIYEKDET